MTQAFDAAGHLLTRTTTDGGVSRAAYTYTYNRAGQILAEDGQVTGDPANGTVSYGYDPLGQLTAQTLGGITTVYGWDATTNRTSVQVGGGTAATTAYDAANRPTAGATPTASYASDDDGRLIARPGQTMTWDHFGRLTAVTDAAGTATYTYDPLDRLRTVDYGGGNRIRFRYVGLTTSAAQWLDDVAGTVTRSIGNGWGGERLLDWTGTSSNRRYYGTNAHHDVTWLADSTGAVSQSLRYDPWGTPRSTPPSGYTPFRFQGSWHDATTDLAWVVTRWYAPSLGRFVSEDTLLGEPRDPDSRQLYAYAAGDPVGAWDPDGRLWVFRQRINWSKWKDIAEIIKIGALAGLACLSAPLTLGLTAKACAVEVASFFASEWDTGAKRHGVTLEAIERQRIWKDDRGGNQLVRWTRDIGVKVKKWRNFTVQKTSFKWAMLPSVEYYETFNSGDRSRWRNGTTDWTFSRLDDNFKSCGKAPNDQFRDWGPTSIQEAMSRRHGRCGAYGAAIFIRRNPMQAEGVQWADTRNWGTADQYYRAHNEPLPLRDLKW